MSSKISYSYGGIDALVANIFKGKKFGIYCDVGSSHPIKNNNTYLLHKKGWLGTNIDLDLKNTSRGPALRCCLRWEVGDVLKGPLGRPLGACPRLSGVAAQAVLRAPAPQKSERPADEGDARVLN